jgi:hypothetical protein
MRRAGQELSRKLKSAAKVRVVRTATLSRIGHPADTPSPD